MFEIDPRDRDDDRRDVEMPWIAPSRAPGLDRDEWTIRVLLPRRFRKAAPLDRYAVRDAFLMPLTPRETGGLDWYFRARRGEVVCPSPDRELDLPAAAQKFGAARFDALYRMWQHRGVHALWTMQGTTLRDQSAAPTGSRTSCGRETT
jgi:hypothetical protein